MRSDIKVVFGPGEEFDLAVDGSEVLSYEAARRWLDEQFLKNDCEALRGTGKVLIADKVLSVAAAVGPAAFADPAWSLDYARAASGALSKALIKVDVPKRSVSY